MFLDMLYRYKMHCSVDALTYVFISRLRYLFIFLQGATNSGYLAQRPDWGNVRDFPYVIDSHRKSSVTLVTFNED